MVVLVVVGELLVVASFYVFSDALVEESSPPPVAITPRDWAMGGEKNNSAVHARLSVSSLGFHPLARFPFSLRQTRNV